MPALLSRLLSSRAILAAFAVGGTLAARGLLDKRPVYATAALDAPGAVLPRFRLPRLGGDSVIVDRMTGRPIVLALWSRDCSASRAALAGIELLQRDYVARGVQVVIVADDAMGDALARAMHDAGVTTPVAVANGRLQRLFDRSRLAPERHRHRVRFALPGFLVADATGRVVHRAVGVPLEEYRSGPVRLTALRAALDSLLTRGALSPGALSPGALSQAGSAIRR